jgi:cell division cycle 14
VQNGDLNWILPGKLLAFAGPTAVAKVLWGYRTFTPEDYWGYFREHGVSAVVRLNNKVLRPFSSPVSSRRGLCWRKQCTQF